MLHFLNITYFTCWISFTLLKILVYVCIYMCNLCINLSRVHKNITAGIREKSKPYLLHCLEQIWDQQSESVLQPNPRRPHAHNTDVHDMWIRQSSTLLLFVLWPTTKLNVFAASSPWSIPDVEGCVYIIWFHLGHICKLEKHKSILSCSLCDPSLNCIYVFIHWIGSQVKVIDIKVQVTTRSSLFDQIPCGLLHPCV